MHRAAAAAAIVAAAVVTGLLLMTNSPVPSDGSGDGTAAPGLDALASAIAKAENVPASANNPGALALGDLGYGVFNSAGVSIFATYQDGLNALLDELQKVENGVAKYLKPNMTLSEFAMTWTGNDNPTQWANTVAQALGVSTDTTVAQILGDSGSTTNE